MRTKFKNAARLIVVFMILITSTKCQTDDHLEQANDKTLLSAKQWFKNYETEGNNYALFQNLNYDWSDAAITNSEDGTKTIIVPINEVKKDPTENWEQKLYIYKLAENYYEASLIEIYPDKNNTDSNSSLIESGIFSGYISVGDLKKGFLKVAKFENGQLVENGIINLRSKSKTAKAPSNQVPCPVGTDCDTDTGGGAIDLKEVVVNNNYKDPSGYIITYNYGGWSYTGGITPADYTNHGTGASGITAPTPVQIIDALTGKAKCLNALLNKNGDSFVQNLLANFQGKSEFNIQIVSKDVVISKDSQGVEREINGRTLPPEGKLITIEISTSKATNNASLDVVRTILHEYIHADIFRKLDTEHGTEEERLDFKTTLDAYGNQHNAIVNLYLSSMKETLKAFHKNVLTDDYNKYTQYYGEVPSDSFYEALAWGGLRENNVKAWTDLPADKKSAIEALANRTPLLSKAIPCNN